MTGISVTECCHGAIHKLQRGGEPGVGLEEAVACWCMNTMQRTLPGGVVNPSTEVAEGTAPCTMAKDSSPLEAHSTGSMGSSLAAAENSCRTLANQTPP